MIMRYNCYKYINRELNHEIVDSNSLELYAHYKHISLNAYH